MTRPVIHEEDLHAYADGQLNAARAQEVARWLALEDPDGEAAQQLRTWDVQRAGLRALYGEALEEALPPALAAAARGVPPAQPIGALTNASAAAANEGRWRRRAGGLSLLLVGGVLGWMLHALGGSAGQGSAALPTMAARSAPVPMTLVRQAAVAHNVYSSDMRRPVEVGADQEQALVTWLSRRLGAPVRAPKLAPLGYDLVGGRLLPGQSGPVAQFMYQDAAGQRLTLYVSHDQAQNQDSGFRFATEGKLNQFYWIDGQFGYALSGTLDKPDLARLASSVYEQLAPAVAAPAAAAKP